MDIINVTIDHFLTIGHAELDLDNRGLLLIQGANLDDSSAKSNGAGKSSIVDAICWCLYGTTARDESGDVVVNKKAKKDCSVVMILHDAGTSYRVERYRKHSKHKNQLYVWQLGATPVDPDIPLHKGTERETQEMLTKLMGCSHPVFVGSIYAGQEQMPDLPGMTDKQLKLLVEEAAGVEELAECYAIVSKDATATDKALAVAQSELTGKMDVEETAKQVLEEARERRQTFEDSRKDRAKAELAKVPTLQSLLTSWAAEVAKFDEPALTKRKGEIEALLAGLKGEQDELQRLQHAARTTAVAEALARTKVKNYKALWEEAVEDLANVRNKVGMPCGECGKPYCEHDVEAALKLRQADEQKAKKTLAEIVEDAKKVIAQAADAKKAVEGFEATMTDVTAVTSELRAINDNLADLAAARHKHATILRDIEACKDAAKAKLAEPNPHDSSIAGATVNLSKIQAQIADAQAAVDKLTAQCELLADAVKVFGPAGVRAHILDTVTPFLNTRTAEYLGTLADGNIHATWSTLSTTAKGELREKFNIAVTNDHGGETFKLQSGGEKRKVRLACAMALQDMQASRASKPINLFMADEIDDALDDAGLERLMSVLEVKARERGTVMVISHNALTDWIDDVITVTKSGGESTISGANVRTF